jgi:DNA polymerase-3 subunit epsilon
LADADLIFQFWEKLWPLFSAEVLQQTIATLTARPALPAQLDPDLPERIPEGHGVYIFYGENNLPLYVGKSNHLRKRVLSHFASDHARGKEMSLSMQVRRVDWIETGGEIAALLLESSLVKKLLPTHNQRLRRNKELCSWRVAPQLEPVPDGPNAAQAELVWARDLNLGAQPDLYGIFRSQRDAVEMLTEIARKESLCKVLLGLEKAAPGAACFGFQLKTCRGGCIGRERLALHHARLLMALSKLRLPAWPHRGPIGLREDLVVHVVDAWCYLGSASREDEIHSLLANGRPEFDLDIYKILRKAMRCLPTVAL